MNFLTVDKIPFALAFLLGLLGYQINQVAEATLHTPAIEYDFEVLEETDSLGMIQRYNQCTITNITRDLSFKDLTINMMFDEDSPNSIYSPDIIPVTPSSLHNITLAELNNIIVEYKIDRLQPSFLYRLTFKTLTDKEHPGFPKLFLTTDTTVRLIEASTTTWLTKNYLTINFVLIFSWVALVILYIVYIYFFNSKKENETPRYSYYPKRRFFSSPRLYNPNSRR